MSPIATAIAQAFETLANSALSLDPASVARLDRLEGKSILIELAPANPESHPRGALAASEAILVTFRLGAVHVQEAREDDAASVHVRGSAADIASSLLGGSSTGRLRLDGDETVLSEARGLLSRFRPDVETPLRSIVGDQSAETLANVIDAGSAALRAIFEGVAGEARRISTESAAAVSVSKADLDAFSGRLHELQLRVDRLTERAKLASPQDTAEP